MAGGAGERPGGRQGQPAGGRLLRRDPRAVGRAESGAPRRHLGAVSRVRDGDREAVRRKATAGGAGRGGPDRGAGADGGDRRHDRRRTAAVELRLPQGTVRGGRTARPRTGPGRRRTLGGPCGRQGLLRADPALECADTVTGGRAGCRGMSSGRPAGESQGRRPGRAPYAAGAGPVSGQFVVAGAHQPLPGLLRPRSVARRVPRTALQRRLRDPRRHAGGRREGPGDRAGGGATPRSGVERGQVPHRELRRGCRLPRQDHHGPFRKPYHDVRVTAGVDRLRHRARFVAACQGRPTARRPQEQAVAVSAVRPGAAGGVHDSGDADQSVPAPSARTRYRSRSGRGGRRVPRPPHWPLRARRRTAPRTASAHRQTYGEARPGHGLRLREDQQHADLPAAGRPRRRRNRPPNVS